MKFMKIEEIKPIENGANYFEEKKNLDQIAYLTEYEKDEYVATQPQSAETESQLGEDEIQISHSDDRRSNDTVIDYDDKINTPGDLSTDDEDESRLRMPDLPFRFLIIDCSPIVFIDTVGAKTLRQVS